MFGPGICGVFYCGRLKTEFHKTPKNHWRGKSCLCDNALWGRLLKSNGISKCIITIICLTKNIIILSSNEKNQLITTREDQKRKEYLPWFNNPSPQWWGATLICCLVMRNRYMTHGYRLRTIIASLTTNKSPHTYYYISTVGWIRICIFLLNIQSMSIQSLCLVTAKSTRDHSYMMNSIDLFPFQLESALKN